MEGMIGEIKSFIFVDNAGTDSPIGVGVTNDHLSNPLGVGVTNDHRTIVEDARPAATATECIISDDFWF
jgi:hypothetical protein